MRRTKISLMILVRVISMCLLAVFAVEEGEAYSPMSHGLIHIHDSSSYASWPNAGDDDKSLEDLLARGTVAGKIYNAGCNIQFAYIAISPDDSSEAEISCGLMKTISYSQERCNACSKTGAKILQGSTETDVPEPTTMLLFATGLVGVIAFKKRKSLKKSDELN